LDAKSNKTLNKITTTASHNDIIFIVFIIRRLFIAHHVSIIRRLFIAHHLRKLGCAIFQIPKLTITIQPDKPIPKNAIAIFAVSLDAEGPPKTRTKTPPHD
jgi:hypothetical protein